jgi:putative ABC transport system permease protein
MVMRSAYIKDCARHVRGTFNRFLAICSITALGVAFFAGLKATAPDMRLTADKYFNDLKFMDIRVVSTAGLTDSDVSALKKVSGVGDAQPAYTADAAVKVSDGVMTVKLLSLDMQLMKTDSASVINRPSLESGRLPRSDSEIVADPRFIRYSGLKTGDTVTLTSGKSGESDMNGTLSRSTFTIVGVARDPLYVSYERGSSAIGSGSVDAYLILPRSVFTLGAYTDAYLRVSGAEKLPCFGSGYKDLVKTVKTAVEKISAGRETARYSELKNDGQSKIDDAEAKLAEQEKKLTDAASALSSAKAQIDGAQAELDSAKEAYSAALAQYQSGLAQYDAKKAEYDAAKAQYDAASGGLTDAQLRDRLAAIRAAQSALPQGMPGYAEKYAQLGTNVQQINALLEKSAELSAAAQTLGATKTQLDAANSALAGEKAQIDSGAAELAQSQSEYDKNKAEYDRQYADAQPSIESAKKDIADAKAKLASLAQPKWYVLGRDSNEGFVGFGDDADRIAAIANVFPLIFFLVAVLVSLTTMTRLVEDDRTYIGTLKALGISRRAIVLKYVLYAAAASAAGGVAGLFIGYNLFPRVIFAAYCILYTMPDIIAAFNVRYAVISLAAAGSCAILPSLFVCLSSLRGSPAGLMRPQAPAMGRRILLERIKPLWSRLNFSQKVTARNLFRYKKRFIMTVVGVAGCTSLIFTGFGLRDAIMPIVKLQYGSIRTYSFEISLADDPTQQEIEELEEYLRKDAGSFINTRQQSVTVINGGADKSVYLVVPLSGSLDGFIDLRQRVGGAHVARGNDSVIVSEKLAKLLNVKKGGSIKLRTADGTVKSVKVGGIAENYLFHYIYMSPRLYSAVFGQTAQKNLILSKAAAGVNEKDAAGELMQLGAVSSVNIVDSSKENFSKMIVALNFVVIVLIISAALLAFVVLMSLTSINIDERGRELATLKVLGFYHGELARYIYRENVVLTAISSVIGLVLGIFLQRFVITTAEVDLVMFSRSVSVWTYVWSAGLTFVFAFAANAFMYSRIIRTDMVASLKSGE